MNNNKSKWPQVVRNYRFQSLFIKNLLIVLVLTLLPFAGISIVVYQQMNSVIQTEIGSINENSLYRIRDVVDTIVQQSDLMATKLSLQPEVELFVFSPNPQRTLQTYYREIYRSISLFTSVYKYVDSIYIYSERNQYIVANSSGMPFAAFKDNNWHAEFLEKEDNSPWAMPRKKEDSYPYYITMVRPMYLYLKEKNGAVIVNIHMEELGKMIGNQRQSTDERMYIIDGNGTVLFSGMREDFQRSYLDVPLLGEASLAEGSEAITVAGQNYIKSTTRSEVMDWTYVSILPIQHYQERMEGFRSFMMTFSLIGLIVVAFVSFLISVRTFAPVKKIISVLDRPQQPDKFDSPEIKYILNHIHKHSTTRQEMELELERRMELLNKARSLALQSQINPHFLYNTLDTIRWTAIRLTGRDNDASNMISSLSDLMRLSTTTEGHLIPIVAEIEHARKYVDILQYRYDDMVSVHWSFPDELLNCQIVQLSLQPIIENAVYHGIKPTRQKGNVTITGKSIGASLMIEVLDDGKGMPPAKVQQLNQMLDDANGELSGRHIGLQNVNQRIKLLFGGNYGLTVKSEEGNWTLVTLWLPMMQQEG